ncbi:MAG: ATP-binding cassette domain-containing protein [Lactobacillales bacterium]|jgi:ABC-2 type transport system ATP-binding protein|nr:ATP-binding cassette domain-containing protein [Lactobacillales bacterium]
MNVSINDLEYSYHKNTNVFTQLNLIFKERSIYAIVGENGIGKTTLLNLLAGWYQPDHGVILYNQKSLTQKEIKFQTAYIPCNISLYPLLNAYDHIDLMAELWEMKKAAYQKYKEKVLLFLQQLRLDALTQAIEEYSSGMKYKLYFSLMLAREIQVLLLDEPFHVLDENSQKVAMEIIQSIKSHVLVIFSSHQKEMTIQLADQIIDLNKERGVTRHDQFDVLK